MNRILIWSFVLLLFLNQVTLVYADEVSQADKVSEADRGSEETLDLTDIFYAKTTLEDCTLHVPFKASWFRNDARIYNHDLAKLSLGLATSAFRPESPLSKKSQPADYNLRAFLEQAGFDHLRSDDYDKNPSKYTVSTVMGHQTIGDGEDAFELIVIGICGQGYADEWESNLSVGTGKNPTGFASAAHLVYDRVFGYISENHLKGKMKVWLSGFSRAAAVSNITASLLSDSDTFSQENVFAYTFATPMTVRDTEPKLYENIFNICGKMDPVTNIPFADWGYSRYGITFHTPALETDSDFWLKREKADVVYKDILGISYWANPDMSGQMRVLMDCLLHICPDVETYHNSLEKYLISLWEKHDAVSVMTRLLEMAEDPILINDDNRVEANILMNQIFHLLLDYIGAENSFRRFNQKASVGANLMQAHTPELYVSWVFSADDPADLYSDFFNYTTLYVTGDTKVTICRDNKVLETLETGENNIESYHYLSIRDFKSTVLIPRDQDYEVSICSNAEQTVEVFEAGFQVGRQAPEETLKYSSDMKTGDVLTIDYSASGRTITPSGSVVSFTDYQQEKSHTSMDLLLNVYSLPENVTWRDLVLFFLMTAVLLVTAVLFIISLVSMWIRHRYKRKRVFIPKDMRFRPLPIICFFLIQELFLAKEFITALYDPSPGQIINFKFLIGGLLLIIAIYGYRRRKNRFHKMIIFAVVLLSGADIMMTTSIAAGAVLYIAAYILLCVNYAWEDRPGIFRILIWIALSAAAIRFLMRIEGDFGYLWYLAVLYIITGTALVVTSFTHSARISRGSFLLFVAGILIVLNTAWGNNFFLHFGSAALHYIAMCIVAGAGSGFTLPTMVPEYVSEAE